MFDKVIFAGGGHRCWWQAGFWEVLRAEIELRPRVIGAVSAGAFMACLVYANDSRRALAWYERELVGVRTNLAWLNLFRRGEPLFRQGAIYRKAIRALLGGEHFRQLMWQAPEMRIQYAIPPRDMSERQAAWQAWRAYRRDAGAAAGGLHAAAAGGASGFRAGVKRLQDCRTEREMSDLLWASSCTPPLMSVSELDGEAAYDGGLVDPVPVRLVDDVPGQTLVLTTRRYSKKTPVFASEGNVYVQPSVPVPASSWDFTSPRRFLKTYEQGRRDAESFLRLFGLGTFHQVSQFGGVLLSGGRWPGEERPGDAFDTDQMVGTQTETTGLEREPLPGGDSAVMPVDDNGDVARASDASGGVHQEGEAPDVSPTGEAGTAAVEGRLPAGRAEHARKPLEGTDRQRRVDSAGDRRDAAPAGRVVASAGGGAAGTAAEAPVGPRKSPAGVDNAVAGAAADPADVSEDDDFQHTLGELSDKLFERGRRR
ncbi:MAG: patatin-like phospholipase family protein [Lautropia sp.]|nr:patatin-like phospholipase family protein [Lautropia sp.]